MALASEADLGNVNAASRKEDGKPNLSYWVSQIEGAKLLSRRSWEQARESWEEALGPTQDILTGTTSRVVEARYPIWWASIQSVQPMLYSRTPTPIAEKAFDDLDDNTARVACLCLERLARYLIRSCAFDATMSYMRDTYIHAGKATCRIFFEAKIGNEPKKEYYAQKQIPIPPPQPDPNQQQITPQDPSQPPPPPQMQTIFVDSAGDQLQGDPKALQQDEQGFYIESSQENLEYVCVETVPVHYRDILHTPNARWESEIWWKAYKSILTREEFREKFGEKAEKLVSFTVIPLNDRTPDDEKLLPIEYATLWEIWDDRAQNVYWYCEGYKDDWLTPLNSEGGDPYDLDELFPSPPFILGTCGPDSLFPVPDFVQLRPLVEQLHGMAGRLKILVRALRKRGCYDAGVPGLKAIQDEADEAEFVALENFKELIGDGGLESVIKYFPTGEISEAITQLTQVIQQYEDKFNEIYGIPDILRGTSDPNETAAAQQMKGRYLSLRASTKQREFQRIVRDSIEMMCDLALKKFPQEKLVEVMGVKHMKPEDQQVWPETLVLLQDDDERKIRIDIETDSTITMNEGEDIEQRNYLAKTLLDGLAGVATAMQQNPIFAPAAMEALLFVVRGLQKGKELESVLKTSLDQAMQAAQQPQPDPEQQKIQGQMQLQQQKQQGQMQIEQFKAQTGAQTKQMEAGQQAQIEGVQAQADIAVQDRKAQSEIAMSQMESKTKLELETMLATMDAHMKLLEAKLQAVSAAHDHALQNQKFQHDTVLKLFDAKIAEQQSKLEAKHAFEAAKPE